MFIMGDFYPILPLALVIAARHCLMSLFRRHERRGHKNFRSFQLDAARIFRPGRLRGRLAVKTDCAESRDIRRPIGI
jgi:hypothetical protein